MHVLTAIKTRNSNRAFLDRAVEPALVEAILDCARWAPSGVNSQPWRVAVVRGDSKARLSARIVDAWRAGSPPAPDYQYYPSRWDEPYKGRRLRCGLALYGALGIGREDQEARKAAWENNYRFFGAPVGLLFFLDRRMAQGSWVDMGMFLQSVMLAALAHGLATCPQASLAEYPDIVREELQLPGDLALVCGMALGYPDPDAPVNRFRTERETTGAFTSWYD